MDKKLTIICDGDSWVFGSEIVDPEIMKSQPKDRHMGEFDWIEDNIPYRLSKIFPTILATKLNANLINLAWPADDNNTILNRIISYVTNNYISKGVSTDDLFLLVGWSSPERNCFWYKDEENSEPLRIWPSIPNLRIENQQKFWDYYVEYLWNKEEYLPRHIMNILQFQNFCKVNNINWICFNSFYQNVGKSPNDWHDIDITDEIAQLKLHTHPLQSSKINERQYYNQEYLSIWNMIDDIKFYKKNKKNNTFKSFMELNGTGEIYSGWHPSEQSHKIWAEELYSYIKQNKLINE